MRHIGSVFVLVLAVVALGACTSSGDGQQVVLESTTESAMQANETPPLIVDGPMGGVAIKPSDADYALLSQSLAGGSVELFPVQGPSAFPGMPAQDYPPMGQQGVQTLQEPGVSIYPVGANPYAPPPARYMPAPAPMDVSSAAPEATVYFNHGSAQLSPHDQAQLRAVSEKAKFAPVSRISVEGHASKRAGTGDPVRDNIVNLKESMNRAFEVSKTMMMNGVPAEKLKTTAWGDTKPPYDGSEDKARRVEIISGSGY